MLEPVKYVINTFLKNNLIVTHVEVPHQLTHPQNFSTMLYSRQIFSRTTDKFNLKVLYFYIVGVRVNKASNLHKNLGVMFFETF